MIKLMPYGDRILVKKIQKEKVEKKGSIYIPDQDKNESLINCTIVAISKNLDEKFKFFVEGDKVLIEKHMGNKYKDGDDEYFIISCEHVLAKVEE